MIIQITTNLLHQTLQSQHTTQHIYYASWVLAW